MNIFALTQPYKSVVIVGMIALLMVTSLEAYKYYGLKDPLSSVYSVISAFLVCAIALNI